MLSDSIAWFDNLFNQIVLTPRSEPLEYNIGKNKYFELVQRWGLEDACRHAEEFSPVPRWFSKKRCFRTMAKDEQAMLSEMRKTNIGVNVFWQSSRGCSIERDYGEMSADSHWNALLSLARASGAPKRRRIACKALPWLEAHMLGLAGVPSMPPPQASELSRTIRLDREVARGSYGVLYRATNRDTSEGVLSK